MKSFRNFINRIIPTCLILASLSLSAQDDYTKSGTRVRALPHPKAQSIRLDKAHDASLPDMTAGTYIIVTRPDLASTLVPFVKWKRQQGFRVEMMLMGTNNRDSIRLALKNRYQAASPMRPAQQYVLLVGDVDRLQGCIGKYTPQGLSTHATDLYYGEYTNDYIPEAFCGRLSVADSSQLAEVTAKIIRYEKGLYAPAHQLLLASGNESRGNAPTTTNGQINYLAEAFARYRPQLDTACFRNPHQEGTFDQILAALAMPNAMVNYTAHCNSDGWNNPVLTAAMVDSLHNAVPTLYVNNCCRSNAFNSNCFGERLLRQPLGGAAAVIGATNETFWDEDFYYAIGAKYPAALHPQYDSTRPGAFDPLWRPALYDPHQVSVGAMNYAGCSAVTQSGSPYDAFYWEIYCLLGDPSMVPYMGTSDTLELSVADTIMAGATRLDVSGTPYARIAVTQDTQLLGTAVINADGRGQVILSKGLLGDSVLLTATRPGALAWERMMAIKTPPQGTLATLRASTDATGDTLLIMLANVGADTLRNHHIVLMQNEEESSWGAILPQQLQHDIALLAPNDSLRTAWYIGNRLIGQHPLLMARLEYADSTQCYGYQQISLDINDQRPILIRLDFTDTLGNPVTQMKEGASFLANACFSHEADSVEWFTNGQWNETQYRGQSFTFQLHWPENQSHMQIQLAAHKDLWEASYGGWLLPYRAVENFESESGSSYGWKKDNDFPWEIDSSTAHSGNKCLRSASVGNSQRSSVALDIHTLVDDSITFYYSVSSEGSDWLYFYIDGQRRGYWSGNSGWKRYARHLPAGNHHLEWIYQKDASGQERSDCAWIDDISFPLALWPTKCGSSVQDTTQSIGFSTISNTTQTLSMVPNPASSAVWIETTPAGETRQIAVYNTAGEKVDEFFIAPNCNRTQYSIAHLRLGIYLIVLKSSQGISSCKLSVIR